MLSPKDIQALGGLMDKDSHLLQHQEQQDDDYVVEQLDYAYIKGCANVKELWKLLRVLKYNHCCWEISGKEGFYPDLEASIEARIMEVDPISGKELQGSSSSLEDVKKDSRVDLENWLLGMKKREDETKTLWPKDKSTLQKWDSAPAESVAKNDGLNSQSAKEPSRSIRIKAADYRAWDNFDVNGELEKLDTGTSFVSSKNASKLSDIPPIKASVRMDILAPKDKSRSNLEFLADIEKNKGNDAYKAGEYEEAVAFYTRSLKILERAHVYTNRAAAYLKLKSFERAENDSSAAIELHDSEFMFKGYIRRAEARRNRRKLREALQDIGCALKLDHNSPLALRLQQECEKEYRAVEGDLAEEVIPSRTEKIRLKILDVEEQAQADAGAIEASPKTLHSNVLSSGAATHNQESKSYTSVIQIEDVDDDVDGIDFDDIPQI